MAEDSAKTAEAAPKKSKMGLVIGIVIALITLIGGSVAGAVLGPKLLGGSEEHEAPAKAGAKGHKAAAEGHKGAAEGHEAGGSPEKITSVDMPPIVVDLRDGEGRIRHLKVGLTAELGETVTTEDFKLVIPRGREATLGYLRSLTFEEVSDPKQFAVIKDELAKRVIEAVGEERVHRLLLTDFVLQ
jgi:flagellar protein FliL